MSQLRFNNIIVDAIISDTTEYQVPFYGGNKSVYFRTEEVIANTSKLLLLHLGDISVFRQINKSAWLYLVIRVLLDQDQLTSVFKHNVSQIQSHLNSAN